jgi:hypothetical protein
MRYVADQDDAIARWVASRIPHVGPRGFGACKAIGVVTDGGELVAGLVYHNWGPEQGIIDLSCAAVPGSGWMTRETIRVMYGYPFHECGVQMVTHCVRAEDERTQRILAALGCMMVRIPRLYSRECDGVLALLTQEAWDAGKFSRRAATTMKEAA